MTRNPARVASVLLLAAVAGTSIAIASAKEPSGYTMIGLGLLDPEDPNKIIGYTPGLTLLYDLSEQPVHIRKRNDPTKRRPYRRATTQNGLDVLVLDEGGTISRSVDALDKYNFLVNRPLPACYRRSKCSGIWLDFDRGKRGGPGWYTVYARQAGKFAEVGPDPDTDTWEVSIHDNIDGWVPRFIPAKKDDRSVEDLGYITRHKRLHPLFRFSEMEGSQLNTSCNQQVEERQIDKLLVELRAFAKLGAEASVQPTIPLPFAKTILRFLGVDAEVKAEASAEGEVTFDRQTTTETAIMYGAANESWETKSIRIERVREGDSAAEPLYRHYGNMLVRKVYHCEGNTKDYMLNANFTIFLGGIDVAVDFEDPLPPINFNAHVVKQIGLRADPQFPAMISLDGQEDYDRLMAFLLVERGLPRSVAHFIMKEINLSNSLD